MGTLFRNSVFCIALVLGAGATLSVAAEVEEEPDFWVPVGFVIVRSTSDFSEARRFAEAASSRLDVPLDFRGLQFDSKLGLSFSPEVCQAEASVPHPCYLARGRDGAGTYLSVERSDAYATFEPGLYVVIAATGAPDSPELVSFLTEARRVYPDAYLKRERVYHGCMH